MTEEHYGEPTDSLLSMMNILWKMEDNLYEIMGYNIVNREQLAYLKRTAKQVDNLSESLQHIIDLGDE